MRTTDAITLSLALLAVVALALPASAHELEARHRAIVSVKDTGGGTLGADVLVMLEIPKGDRARKLFVRFDINRNGKLDAGEAQALASQLGPETIGGFVLRHNLKAVRPAKLKATASVTREGSLAVALLLTYELPTIGRVGVRILEERAGAPLAVAAPISVELQTKGEGLKIVSSSLPPAPDAPVIGPVEVKPGGEPLWMIVTAKPR